MELLPSNKMATSFQGRCWNFLVFLNILSLSIVKSHGRDVSFALNKDHASYKWRSMAGKPEPTMQKTLVWMLHEQV
jgi:superoxide dismutase